VDKAMLDKAKLRLKDYDKNMEFVHGSYKDVDVFVKDRKVDYFLLDIGVNLEHFRDGERGFSVQWDADLDMRFDQKQEKSAFDIVNHYPKEEVERVLVEYAEFRQPTLGKIINALMAERKNKIITKTKEFKEILYTCGL
jgi:16S rRNA (cytosine1402-N4)-methyltransferase